MPMNDLYGSVDAVPEEIAAQLGRCAQNLCRIGRYDFILSALDASLLEELRIEAARKRLSKLVITADYRFQLPVYDVEVELSPVHKAVYLLFLNHPEGIEFKRLSEYRAELYRLYKETSNRMDMTKVEESVARLTDPFDNAINEKCSRIKKAFCDILDEYTATYYIISSHKRRLIAGSSAVWYQRLKVITLPRELVVYEADCHL